MAVLQDYARHQMNDLHIEEDFNLDDVLSSFTIGAPQSPTIQEYNTKELKQYWTSKHTEHTIIEELRQEMLKLNRDLQKKDEMLMFKDHTIRELQKKLEVH